MESSTPSKLPQLLLPNFSAKFLTKGNLINISNKHFSLCEAEISLDEIIKSINSATNNKSPK